MARRLIPGEALEGIPASDWNEFADAADLVRGLRAPTHEADRNTPHLGGGTVRVMLDADREPFNVVGLDEPMTTIADNANAPFVGGSPIIKGVTPTSDHAYKFAILLKGGVAGNIVPAVAVGIAWVQVDLQAESDTTAGVIASDASKLEGGKRGAKILNKPSGTGVKWCQVLIGTGSTQESVDISLALVKIIEEIPARTTDDAAAYKAQGGHLALICTPGNVGTLVGPSAGVQYDFTSATAGDIVLGEQGFDALAWADGKVDLYNTSRSLIRQSATNDVIYWHAKSTYTPGNARATLELVSPTELRSLPGHIISGDQLITNISDDVAWEDIGACS